MTSSPERIDRLAVPPQAAVIVADAQAAILGWSAGAQHLHGWRADEILGRDAIEVLVDPPDLPRARDALSLIVAGRPWSGTLWLRHRDDDPFEADVVARPIFSSADEVAAIVALVRPASEEGDAGRHFGFVPSLHEHERTRLALRASGLGTWSWDETTGEVRWDETMERIFGLRPGTFDGTYESYLAALHPGDRDTVMATVRNSLATRGEHRVEHRVIWPDGSVHWVEGWGRALLDGRGEAVGLVGVSLDITERRRSEMRLRQLQRVTAALARARTIAEVGRVAVEELLSATDALVSTLTLLEDGGRTLRVVATSVPEADLPEEWRTFDVGSNLTAAEAVRTGRLVIRDVADAQGPSAVLARMLDAGEATQVMALPLRAGERTLGAITLALDTVEPADEGVQHFLLTLGTQLGQALERAILHEGEMEASARIRLLADASSLLGRSLDYRQTIGQVALAAVPGFADWCGVDLLDEHGELQSLAIAHADPDKVELARRLRLEYPPDPEATGGSPVVARTGRSELLGTIPKELIEGAVAKYPELAELIEELQLTSAMTVPLIARGQILGTMSFVWGESGRHYDETDLAFAEELAARAAIAIDNARLYDEQRNVAATLQASLRPPQLPSIEGVDIAAEYRPGGIRGEVGGDFYDVFPLRESSWLAVVGDVCGKGVPAAAVMALARYTIRTAALTRSHPHTILATLNEALLRSELDRFCTACVVRIDETQDGPLKITVCVAGHPPPVLIRKDGASFLDVRGTLLGVFEDPDFEDLRLELAPGETLLLYTDGVTEERRDGELFGDERLIELAESLAGPPAEQVARRIVEAVAAFRPGPPADDIAILALRNP